jgi:hypothetical protein
MTGLNCEAHGPQPEVAFAQARPAVVILDLFQVGRLFLVRIAGLGDSRMSSHFFGHLPILAKLAKLATFGISAPLILLNFLTCFGVLGRLPP